MAPPAEIFIPTTSLHSPSDNSKPYTLYNITLRLPLRSFVVQKRYSDFDALHASLTSHVGAPPPYPLPAKSWFKSTVSSPALTESRRKGLETYLRAIAESPDRRWRDTAVWRAFLNLPSGSTSNSAASASGVRTEGMWVAIGSSPAAGDPGTWLDMYKELKDALHDARRCLNSNGRGAGETSTAAKRSLVKAGALLATLGHGLRALQEGGRLGEGELRRRRDLLNVAQVERDGLEKLAATMAAARIVGVSATGGGVVGSLGWKAAVADYPAKAAPKVAGRVLGAPLPETDRTRELENKDVVGLQQRTMREQDQDVEELATVVRRQREIGMQIQSEVERHIELLKQTESDVDRVQQKVNVANSRTRKLRG